MRSVRACVRVGARARVLAALAKVAQLHAVRSGVEQNVLRLEVADEQCPHQIVFALGGVGPD